MTTTEYLCDHGHAFAAPTVPKSCPHMVAGKPCLAEFVPGHWTRGGKWVAG